MASSSSPSPPRRTSTFSSDTNYAFPSEVNVANFVPIKLGLENYDVWKKLMLNLIESHRLVGFVDGTIQPPEEEQNEDAFWSWKRSDGLVRGWIFVTVTEELLPELVRLKTAEEVWNELAVELDSSDSDSESSDEAAEEIPMNPKRARKSQYLPLHKATLNGVWESATKFFEQKPNGVRVAFTSDSETALMLAVQSSKRNHFVEKLMERMSPDDVARADSTGETALHKAVASGNNVAAKLLVVKNPKLPKIEDKDGDLAVHFAAERGNREMVDYLLEVTKLDGNPNPFKGKLGVGLLNALAYGELYDIASAFLRDYPDIASMKPSPLIEMGYHLTSFRSGTHLNFFQRLIYSGIPLKLEGNANNPIGRDIENSAEGVISSFGYLRKLPALFWDVAEKLVPPVKFVRETKLIHHQALEFVTPLCEAVAKSDFSKAEKIFRAALKNAVSLGTGEIVEEIVLAFPSVIDSTNKKDQNIFHVAIENRRANVFNLIYQLDVENQKEFLAEFDMSGNNTLHTAGNLLSQQQLSLRASVAGAALQMQRELQWFKEVKKLIPPQANYDRNKEDKTPQDVFTETHKDLVESGEKWMKDTASSCTIVAALIVTVAFAAAITVPGGINSDSGFPIFLEDEVFVLFAMFDALALFSSTTSLLMFLSILTSRYAQRDFLYSLPRKLIIGLVTLFLSIMSMMIAFGATLKILFGYKKPWIVIPVVVLSSLPVTLFAWLQFPLLLHMIRSTYFPGIFGKRSNRNLFQRGDEMISGGI